MATVNRSVATLRIAGDSLEPEEVTRLLGCEPTLSQRKGDTTVGKTTGISRVAKTGMWRLCAADQIPGDLDAQISELLGRLSDDMTVWGQITAKHSADLFCGLFMKVSNEGLSLSSTSLAALGNRGIELALDIYDGDDRDA